MSSDSEHEPPGRRPWRTSDEWSRLHARIEGVDAIAPRAPRTRRALPWLVAASLVVASGLVWRSTRPQVTTRTLSTAVGERASIHLPDKTVITLGPASTIRYSLSTTSRDIALTGLAEFKVTHDPSRPFVVRARNAVTTDLGTEFVIRAYAGDSSVDVSVTSGSVSLASATSAVELRAGSAAGVLGDGSVARAEDGMAESRAAWVDGRLVFIDQPLRTVTTELSRWLDVDFEFSDDALAHRHVTAVYNNPTAAGVLEAIGATFGLRAERTGRVITLSPRRR